MPSAPIRIFHRDLLVLLHLFWAWLAARATVDNVWTPPTVVVFSKDRAMQLDLLLRSWHKFVVNGPKLTVLWTSSSERHERAYADVLARNAAVVSEATRERDFRSDLLSLLRRDTGTSVIFLVDDIVVRAPLDFHILRGVDLCTAVPSLRLGENTTYCQVEARQIRRPPLQPTLNGWLRFKWTTDQGYWSMPLSVDGHVFNRLEILAILRREPFRAPNTLERSMGPYRFFFRWRKGLCQRSPSLLNLAMNGVESEGFEFPHGDVDAEYLLKMYEEGFEFELASVSEFPISSCHVTVAPPLRRRETAASQPPPSHE